MKLKTSLKNGNFLGNWGNVANQLFQDKLLKKKKKGKICNQAKSHGKNKHKHRFQKNRESWLKANRGLFWQFNSFAARVPINKLLVFFFFLCLHSTLFLRGPKQKSFWRKKNTNNVTSTEGWEGRRTWVLLE